MEVNNNYNSPQPSQPIGDKKDPFSAFTAKNYNQPSKDTVEFSAKVEQLRNQFKNKFAFKKENIKNYLIAAGLVIGGALAYVKGKNIISGIKNKGSKIPDFDASQIERRRKLFDNFDSSPILDKIPTERELEAAADGVLSAIKLEPAFDESKVTHADLVTLINDLFFKDGWSLSPENIATSAMYDKNRLHLLNNIASLVKSAKKDALFFSKPDTSTLDRILNQAKNSHISQARQEEILKLYKALELNGGGSIYELAKIFESDAGRITQIKQLLGLNTLIKAKTKDIGEVLDVSSFFRFGGNDINIPEMSEFFTNLRVGNIAGSNFRGAIDSNFKFKKGSQFLSHLNQEAIKVITDEQLGKIVKEETMTTKQLGKKLNKISKDRLREIYARKTTLETYFNFEEFLHVKNINELDQAQKRSLMKKLVRSNVDAIRMDKTEFPILPSNQKEYCALLQKLSKSIGIATNPLTPKQLQSLQEGLGSVSTSISGLDLSSARLELTMPREDFVRKAQGLMAELPSAEKNKVMDYFGFEIKDGKLMGYPINVNNGEKLADIENNATKAIVQQLRPIVEEFSGAQNKVRIAGIEGATALENDLNKLLDALPELRSIIGRAQHGTHAFTLDIHTLKVLQQVCSDPKFSALSDSDKKVLQISSLLHDITKAEGAIDDIHPIESAFDAYYIIQKLNLPESEQLKIYQLIKTHSWLNRLNKAKPEMVETIAQDIAFDARHTNTFELAKILCEADLKSVHRDTSFFEKHKACLAEMSDKVDGYLRRIKETQIVLPQAKIPKASEVIGGRKLSADGVSNTVIFMDNAPDDLSRLGFQEGCTKGNFLGLVHALERPEQMNKFDTFSIIDSDALLSTSYIKADDYRVFRNQGLILDVASDDIHAGYFKDFGTGYSKDIELLKQDYLFATRPKGKTGMSGYCSRGQYRDYISAQVKGKLGLADSEYIEIMEKIKDCKSIEDISKIDKTFADGLLDVFREMNNGKRRGGRAYNEMLVSRPHIQGVFAYDKDYKDIPLFLRQYAQDNNLPIIIFGKSK